MKGTRRGAVVGAMGLALLGLSASLAAAQPPSPAVRIWLRLPPEADQELLERTLPDTERVLAGLLKGDFGRKVAESGAPRRTALRYDGPGWKVGTKARVERLALLKKVWGEDLRVEDPAARSPEWPWTASAEPSVVMPLPRSVDLGAAQKGLGATLPSVMGTVDGGAAFDGSAGKGSVTAGYAQAPAGDFSGRPASLPGQDASWAGKVPARTSVKSALYEEIIRTEAAAAGVDPAVMRALISAKSGFNADFDAGGVHGLTMISHGAAKTVGVSSGDLNDPRTNVRAGSLYLARLLKQFHGDLHRALAAYQVGPGAVVKSGGIPNDPQVKNFLAAFELAYRKDAPVKPPVVPVAPPKSGLLREAADAINERRYPAPKDPLARYRPAIEKNAKQYGVDPDLVEAVMRQENPWGDPKRVSDAGAVGLMQIMPGTAFVLGIDPYDAEQNIRGGVKHLKFLLDEFGGDRVLAVAAYNSGHNRVQRLGRVPNITETVTYVTRVFKNYERLTGEKVDYSGSLSPWGRKRSEKVEQQLLLASGR